MRLLPPVSLWAVLISAVIERGIGIIMVYTGILPICRDEQGLAAVLAHGSCMH